MNNAANTEVYFALATPTVEVPVKIIDASGVERKCIAAFKAYLGEASAAKQKERQEAIDLMDDETRDYTAINNFLFQELAYVRNFPMVNAHGKEVDTLDTRDVPEKYAHLFKVANLPETAKHDPSLYGLCHNLLFAHPVWMNAFQAEHMRVVLNLSAEMVNRNRAKN